MPDQERNKNKLLIWLIPIIALSGLVIAWLLPLGMERFPQFDPAIPRVILGDEKIIVDLADTPAEWYQGLSDRPEMGSDRGMLFRFPDKQVRTFCMRRMHFPLDIIWLDDDTVVRIDRDLPPEGPDPKETYPSGAPINRVLELNAGLAERTGLRVGDKVIYKIK